MDNKPFSLTIEFIGFKQIRLVLTRDGEQLSTVDFSFDSNLDTVLIDSIDKLLKENTIDPLSLHIVNVAGDVDKDSSAYKVAVACAEALKTL
jgi:hypothetical protein